MSNRYTCSELKSLADKAGQSIDAYITAIAVQEQHDKELSEQRRASADEKTKISQYLDSLSNVNREMSAADIVAAAGVRKVQGTKSFATRELKRVLQLTHKKAA